MKTATIPLDSRLDNFTQNNIALLVDVLPDSAICRMPLVRNEFDVIIAAYGVIEDMRQSVDLWVEAHKIDDEGDTDQEIIKLTVPLTGPVKPLILEYINGALPGYQLHDWAVWPCEDSANEPF